MDGSYTFEAEGRHVTVPGIVTASLPNLGPSAYDFLGERTQTFGNDNCFICGRPIPTGSPERSREDVFPKWLMREAGPNRSEVSSLNGRFHRYGSVLIPCCKTCNNEDWSRVENRVRRAFLEGTDALRALPAEDLVLWATKVYYGLMYRESLLSADIRNRTSHRLIPENHLRSLGHLHLNLQVAGGHAEWGCPPASVFIFDCEVVDGMDRRSPLNFDFFDDTEVPMIGVRLHGAGVVVMLADWGRLAWHAERDRSGHCWAVFGAASAAPLHPTQFRELQPVLKHLSLQTDQWNMYTVSVAHPDGRVVLWPSAERVVEQPIPFNVDRFSFDLSAAWAVSANDVRVGDDVLSTILDASAPNGRILWSVEQGPFVGVEGNYLWPWTGDAGVQETSP